MDLDRDLSTSILHVGRIDEGIWELRLHRPDKRNALSIDLRDDMSTALEALAGDDGVRVVAIAGDGPAFCAGFDLGQFDEAAADPELDARLWTSSDRWHEAVRTFPLPTIASVHGAAMAGGFDLATMCDLRVAARSATFARPEVTFTMPLYAILRDLVGGALARELSFTNRRLDAEEAHRLGLVTRVADDDALAEATLALAREVAANPVEGLRATKARAIAASKQATDAELTW